MTFPKVTVITGHYGSGKTNISVNLALDLINQGKSVTVVDLDIVNPYFRTADFADLFKSKGINLIAPMYANSNLDIPALNFDIKSILNRDDYIIIDVGGDDAGATALGRYNDSLKEADINMLYVINCFRYLTKEPEEALTLMREIEVAGRLKCDGIINNSNLGFETTGEDILKSVTYAEEISQHSKLPVLATTGISEILPKNVPTPYPVKIYVKTLWNE